MPHQLPVNEIDNPRLRGTRVLIGRDNLSANRLNDLRLLDA
jgi:hypothetical protein